MPVKSLTRLYARAQVCSMKAEQIEQARASATGSPSSHILHGIPFALFTPFAVPKHTAWDI